MNDLTKRLQFDEDSHTYKVDGVVLPSVTDIVGPITYTKYRVDNAIIDQAAFRGSMVHELTSLYDRGDLEAESAIAADVGMYLMAWIQFCHDYQPQWEYIELPMACSYMAGTVDRIGVIDGVSTIVDIKTNSSMDRSAKVALALQLYGYGELCAWNDIHTVYANSIGVQLKKDGTYTVHKSKAITEKYNFNPASVFADLRMIHAIAKGDKNIAE